MKPQMIEVEIEGGQVVPAAEVPMPEKASGWLTIGPTQAARDPLKKDPELMKVRFFESPTAPLRLEDWPDAF